MTLRIRDRTYWTDGVSDPHSLLGRSKLNELITGFRLSGKQKAEMRHVVVWGFHLRRAHQDYAWTSLASERFMVADLRGAFDGRWGLARQHIRKAHDDLVAWGFLAVAHKGRGKGDASRYWPNFDLLHQAAAGRFPHAISVTIPADVIAMFGCDIETGNHVVSTSKLGTTSCPVVGTTSYPVEGETGNHVVSEDLITGPGERPESSKVEVSAAASTPAADAPGAATGFERIWNAYGKLGNKQESRKAFAAIYNPDINHITERAASWAASAKPGKKRMPLEKWLAAERYDEADRRAPPPANDNRFVRIRTLTVTRVGEMKDGSDTQPVWTRFDDHDDDEDSTWPVYCHPDTIGHMADVAGRRVNDLVGARLRAGFDDEGDYEYLPLKEAAA